MGRINSYFKEIDIKPLVSDIRAILITKEDKSPSMWLIYKSEIYYAVFKYEFTFFEDYDDWEDFNQFYPREKEIRMLLRSGVVYYKVNITDILRSDNLDEYSENELGLIKRFNRDLTINRILK
jgi:hypothetical protein